jgi:ATP-dependent helicase HrpB
MRDPDPALIADALVGAVRAEGLGILPWSRGSEALRERMIFMRAHDPSWPDLSDEALLASPEVWLGPHLHGIRRREGLASLDLTSILLAMLSWEQRAAIDEWAPTHITVPSGSRIPIDYADPQAPTLSVRLQELFGMVETPRIARGRVPLTIHLLSPAHRPVQVTRDLASFWRTTYFDVKKDLKGRYPKHYWPDDPLQATPTSRARPRGT